MPKAKRKQLRFRINGGPEEKKAKKEEKTTKQQQQQITTHFQTVKRPVYR